jgi:hypothetical protein
LAETGLGHHFLAKGFAKLRPVLGREIRAQNSAMETL